LSVLAACYGGHGADGREVEPAPQAPAGAPAPAPDHALLRPVTDCAELADEHLCVALDDGMVRVFGVDTGRHCSLAVGPLAVSAARDKPSALRWTGSEVLACMSVGTGPTNTQMLRISLADGSVEPSRRACFSVVDWQGGLLVHDAPFVSLRVARYADYAGFIAGDALDSNGAVTQPFASHGASLFTGDGGATRELFAFWRMPGIFGADWREALMASERTELALIMPLQSDQVAIAGADASANDRFVVLRADGSARGLELYDLPTRAPLRSYVLPPEQADGFHPHGLSCDREGTLPL
jgi:hypothetical protein